MYKQISQNIKKIFFNPKIIYLLILSSIYTIIYFLLDDSNFSGVNKVQETIKDELLKKEVDKKVAINNIDNFANKEKSSPLNDIKKEIKKDIAIDKKALDVKKDVKEQELDPEQIEPTMGQQLFNRFYFSITTGCLVGYGDIYPITNLSKFLTLTQSLLTLSLILS